MDKLVFLTSRFPYPVDKGDQLRAFFQLKHLSETYEIHLVALSDKPVREADLAAVRPFCASVDVHVVPLRRRIFRVAAALFGKLPFQVAFFYSPAVHRRIAARVATLQPAVVHCHLVRMTEYARGLHTTRMSLDFMDAFGKGMERREQAERNPLKRLLFRCEKNRLYRYEQAMLDFADCSFIISEQDRLAIPNPEGRPIAVIPNGVDFGAFYPRAGEKRYDLVFMGNMAYPPNVDAVQFLCSGALPLILAERPQTKLLIAGNGAGKQVRQLQSANVDVTGNFSHISDALASAKIMLAPMRLSIGLQNKILQGMAMAMPCIVSTLSNNAVQAPDGTAVIEANTPEEIAQRVLELLTDETRANAIGAAGCAFVKENYSWERQNALFIHLITHRS